MGDMRAAYQRGENSIVQWYVNHETVMVLRPGKPCFDSAARGQTPFSALARSTQCDDQTGRKMAHPRRPDENGDWLRNTLYLCECRHYWLRCLSPFSSPGGLSPCSREGPNPLGLSLPSIIGTPSKGAAPRFWDR